MACYTPRKVYRVDGGPVFFYKTEAMRDQDYELFLIPCGKCIGCQLDKRESWVVRCYCESVMHEVNSFVTLTYDEEHIPKNGLLCYRDVQLFLKRLRKNSGQNFRYFICGEYGETTKRPHYHAIFFGLVIPDMVKLNSVYSKHDLYGSALLLEAWKQGHVSIGAATQESMRYTAGYAVKGMEDKILSLGDTKINVVQGS